MKYARHTAESIKNDGREGGRQSLGMWQGNGAVEKKRGRARRITDGI